MADKLDPTINMLLTRFPEFFKLADHTPGQESTSSAQASATQLKTSRKLKTTKKGRRSQEDTSDASKAGVDHVGESEQAVPDKSPQSVLSETYKGGRPGFSDGSPLPDFVGFNTETGTPSKSKEDNAEPGLSKLKKLADKYDESPDKENQQSLSDLLLKLPTSSKKSSAKRSTSPPFCYALAQRFSILSYRKPRASSLRNEIHRSPADDEKLAQPGGKEPPANANLLEHSHAFHGRATDKSVLSWSGKWADVAKVDEPAASAHLLAKSKDHKEGATEEKTAKKGFERTRWLQATPVKGRAADKDSLVPPILLFKGAPGPIGFRLNLPDSSSGPDQAPELRFREPEVGLSADEWAKVPAEFKQCPQSLLARFWDFTYSSVVRKTVLDYKRELALAGKADKVLDWPNKLLAALVDIQEAEIREVAEHVVDASDIKTSEFKPSLSAIPEEFAEPSGIDILLAELCEIQKSLAELREIQNSLTELHEIQNSLIALIYNTTTAHVNLAWSKGVKLDSQIAPILTKILTNFNKELQNLQDSCEMATTLNHKINTLSEKLSVSELKEFGKGKGEESELVTEDVTTGKDNGNEGDLLVEGSTMGKGKDKDKELPLENAKTGKGKAKESDVLVEDPAIDNKEGNENGLPVNDTTIGKGKGKKKGKGKAKGKGKGKPKGKESGLLLLVEGPSSDKGKGKESDLPLAGTLASKGKGRECDHYEASKGEIVVSSDVIAEAQALFVKDESDDIKPMPLKYDDQSPTTQTEEMMLLVYSKMCILMRDSIRPQTASVAQLHLLCIMFTDPGCYAQLAPLIEELRWNRAVVQHPNNPMITEILQHTQHLRPTDGLHHSSGISVAPLPMPQYGSLPPGPAPATPMVTTSTKKQPKKKHAGITKMQQAPIKVKPPFEDPSRVLDLREAAILAKIRDGVPLSAAQVFGDFLAIGQSRQYLKEKARLEKIGGWAADMLTERQKKMAEQDGAPTDQLP